MIEAASSRFHWRNQQVELVDYKLRANRLCQKYLVSPFQEVKPFPLSVEEYAYPP